MSIYGVFVNIGWAVSLFTASMFGTLAVIGDPARIPLNLVFASALLMAHLVYRDEMSKLRYARHAPVKVRA